MKNKGFMNPDDFPKVEEKKEVKEKKESKSESKSYDKDVISLALKKHGK